MKVLRWGRVLNSVSASFWSIISNSSRRGFLYSTKTTATLPTEPEDTLYRRISPIGDPRVSIEPVLDQWIEEGRIIKKREVQSIIRELRRRCRFNHALEVSHWMSGKRYFHLSPSDVAVRMDLISKVHGIEQAENYFNNIPKQIKNSGVYSALLNCYAQEKSLEKAEDFVQKMRNLEFAKEPLCYSVMLNLYYQKGKYEKLDSLMQEMEEKGIKLDKFTLSIRLTAYAATSDIEGMEKILGRMESDPGVVLDWNAYAIAANGYMKAGLVDNALVMLKKSEALILTSNRRSLAFDYLLTQYAATEKKDEILRLWELYKKTERIPNKGYISMITSLLKFDDIEGAEKVFEEWESDHSYYDFRIPNFLIGVYCNKGLMEEAEALINRAKTKGGKPFTHTWYYLATGYVGVNQITKAVEAMKVAISMCQPGWKPCKSTLVACLHYLKGNGDFEEAEQFIKSLGAKGIVSTDVQEKLLDYMKDVNSSSNANSLIEGDALVRDGEAPKILQTKQLDTLFRDEQISGISELK